MKPTTPHDPLDDLIAAALHGDLSPAERAQFDSRLQTDPAAAAAYLEAQAMHDLLEKTNRTAQPDPDFEQRMVSGVRRKLAQPTHRETAWESALVLWRSVTSTLRLTTRVFGGQSAWFYIGVSGMIVTACAAALYTQSQRPKSVFATITSQLSMASASGSPSNEALADKLPQLPVLDHAVEMEALKDARDLKKAQIAGDIAMPSRPMVRSLQDRQAAAPFTTFLHRNRLEAADDKQQVIASLTPPAAPSAATPVDVAQQSSTQAPMAPDEAPAGAQPNGSAADAPTATTVSAPPKMAEADGESNVSDTSAAAAPSSAPIMLPSVTLAPSGNQKIFGIPGQVGGGASSVPSGSIDYGKKIDSDASVPDSTQKQLAMEQADKLWNPAVASNTPAPEPKPAAPAAAAPQDSRKLIRNAQLDLEVKSFQTAFDQITAMTRGAGGYVDTSNSQRGGNGKLQGTVVVKILPPNLDAFLLRLRDLGDVQNQSVSTDDVTKDYFDTQARLVNSQKMEAQLQDLLKRENGKVSDLLAVERELGRVRGDIEGMQGQLKLYDFQVQYATVTMNIAEKDLNQAAAYLLRELDDFSLYATDVEGTFEKARVAAADYKAQVLVADLKHNSGSDVSAMMVVSVPPDQIESFLAQIRSLGRVANFTRDTKRVPKDGGDPNQPADQALTQSDKVTVNIAIRSDDESRKQVALTVIAKAVDEALDQAKAAALAQPGVEILGSSLNKAPQGASTAQLSVRVPGKEYAAVLEAFRGLGRAASLTIQRRDNSGPGASGDDAPVILSLSLTDEEVPVQTTDLVIVSKNVDDLSQQIKKDAIAAGVEVKASSFEGQPNGTHLARMTLFLPIAKYPDYIATLKKTGRIQSLTVQRNDDAGSDSTTDESPVSITLALTDDDPPVQATQLVVIADDVDTQSQEIKKQAAAAGVEVKDSSFGRDPDGSEHAQMTLHLPMGQYNAYIDSLKKAGKVESLSVQREDRPDVPTTDDSAPVEISLQLHNEHAIVADNAGLWPTLRQMFGEGFGALFGSVRVIGVLLAFIAPWVVTLVLFAWIGRRIYVWRKNR